MYLLNMKFFHIIEPIIETLTSWIGPALPIKLGALHEMTFALLIMFSDLEISKKPFRFVIFKTIY